MRIAFVDSWLQGAAEGSGTAVGISGLLGALEQAGHTVMRIAPDHRPRPLLLRRLLFNATLRARLQRHDFDLVVGFDIDGFLFASAARHHPYAVSIKGVAAEEAAQERGWPRLLLSTLACLERRNVRNADVVFVTSEYCRRAVLDRYGASAQRVRVVPEGIDAAGWRAVAEQRRARVAGKRILCVARQYRRKRVADLIRAMPAVRARIPEARASIVGDGPETEKLRALSEQLGLRDAVTFTGAIADHEVRAAYAEADVFCLPSVQEGFGIVFLEAMASGLPIVSTTATAIPEVVTDGRGGILVPPTDVRALGEALVRLLLDEPLRDSMSRFNRADVERFDWKRVAARFIDQLSR